MPLYLLVDGELVVAFASSTHWVPEVGVSVFVASHSLGASLSALPTLSLGSQSLGASLSALPTTTTC